MVASRTLRWAGCRSHTRAHQARVLSAMSKPCWWTHGDCPGWEAQGNLRSPWFLRGLQGELRALGPSQAKRVHSRPWLATDFSIKGLPRRTQRTWREVQDLCVWIMETRDLLPALCHQQVRINSSPRGHLGEGKAGEENCKIEIPRSLFNLFCGLTFNYLSLHCKAKGSGEGLDQLQQNKLYFVCITECREILKLLKLSLPCTWSLLPTWMSVHTYTHMTLL